MSFRDCGRAFGLNGSYISAKLKHLLKRFLIIICFLSKLITLTCMNHLLFVFGFVHFLQAIANYRNVLKIPRVFVESFLQDEGFSCCARSGGKQRSLREVYNI